MGKVHTRPGRALIAVVIAFGALIAGPSGGAIAGNGTADCGAWHPRFGAMIDPANVTGFYTHLDSQALSPCTDPPPEPTRASFAWSAIERDSVNGCTSGSCPNSIVQVGRGICNDPANPTGCRNAGQRLLRAWGRDSEAYGCSGLGDVVPAPHDYGAAPTDTGLHYYRVWRDATAWHFDHWPKGHPVSELLPAVSVANVCWSSRPEAAAFNETWNQGDALGGSTSNHYNFVSTTKQVAVGGAWSPTTFDPSDPCTVIDRGIYLCDVTGAQSFEVWTNR